MEAEISGSEAAKASNKTFGVHSRVSSLTAPFRTLSHLTICFLSLLLGILNIPGVSAATAPDQGPGGPILVVTSSANPFTKYYAEILRTEGLNAFAVADISTVSAPTLAAYDLVILGEIPLATSQVTMFSDYVTSGGNLISMRPDKKLAGLLGLTASSSTLSDKYLLIDTSTAPGAGLVNQTIQFHGTADLYTTSGAATLATLYSSATTATSNPAVTWQNVGPNGGQAAAFTFDLARSIVYMRQGNPAWSGQQRDGSTPIRPDDLFFGKASFDSQPDWVDLNKVAIPQADEQQRLLANLIVLMNIDKKPLPRFWYFPRGKKAVVVMTSDAHGSAVGVAPRLDSYKAKSAAGCSVADWECIRSTAYIYPTTPFTNAQAAAYTADGFEVALHINTGCADWTTQASLDQFYGGQLGAWQSTFSSAPPPVTNRTHCVVWSDYATQPQVELLHGIRMDTTYYYWPASWILDRPGFFTGSGMPMRFTKSDGTMIDVYQAATQMNDEASQTYPFEIDSLLSKALGPEGYYGAFTANMHSDQAASPGSDAIVASALSHGVSIVSAKQMLTWVDGRNNSLFSALAWNGNTLNFTVVPGSGANNLQVMLPMNSQTGTLASITSNGAPVSYTIQTIKGIQYALFPASGAVYQATYGTGPALPSFTDTTVADFGAGTRDAGTYISQSGDGELTLTPAAGAEFLGSAIPADWFITPFATGGNASIAGGIALIDGAMIGTNGRYSPGGSLEFVATFSGAANQHVGLAVDLNSAPWAIFSTSTTGGALYARTNNGSTSSNTMIPGSWFGTSHRYRIDWNTSTVVFSIDGAVVATHTIAITNPMRPVAADLSAGGGVVTIDWMRLSPYAPSATFLSRVFDAGAVVGWGTALWTTDTPPGTTVSISFRLGNTPVPDGSWTVFTPVASSGSALSGSSRYLQYRAQLATTALAQAPMLNNITINTAPNSSVDTTPPDTFITSGPSGTVTVKNADFSWSGADNITAAGNLVYAYRLDPVEPSFSAFGSTPSRSYTNLANGAYTFYVKARDQAGNEDPTPASRAFSVNVTASRTLTIASVNPTSGVSITVTPNDNNNQGNGVTQFTRTYNSNTAVVLTAASVVGSTSFGSWSGCDSSNGTTCNVTMAADKLVTATYGSPAWPAAPVSLMAQCGANGTQATLTWSAVTGATAYALRINYQSNDSSSCLDGWYCSDPPDKQLNNYAGTSYVATITPGQPYAFWVHAIQGSNFGNPGNGSFTCSASNSSTTTSFTDTTAGDFGGGTGDGNIYVSQTGDGELTLLPTVGAEFSGPGLPAGWFSTLLSTGGTTAVNGGVLGVDGFITGTTGFYGPGHSLEFVANFGGAAFQHVGFGVDFSSAPWAIFSTSGGGGLYARTNNGTSASNTPIPGSWLGVPHRYRIDWNASSIVFSIDGTVVATHNIAISSTMRPLVADVASSGGGVAVDWLRMTPYVTSATFTSRIFDAGAIASWGTASWTSTTPAGTGIGISVRLGNTPVPDGTWTAFTSLSNSGVSISGISRYLQYRVQLTTTDVGQTPMLNDISFAATSSAMVDFSGTILPAGWFSTPLASGGTSSVSGGLVTVDGGIIGTNGFYTVGRTLEFVANFSGAANQHVGFGVDLSSAPWAIFSTSSGGALYARTNSGLNVINTPLPGSWLGAGHRYRIDWNPSSIVFSIDGNVVANHGIAIITPMRPLIADAAVGGGAVVVDWLQVTP